MKYLYKPHFLGTSFILVTFLFVVSLGNISCNKGEDTPQIASDEYYVKYVLESSTIYRGGKLDLRVKTEENYSIAIEVDQNKKWEATFGPVSRGFNATLKATAEGTTHDKLRLNSQIHVSKNDSKFALKKIENSDEPRDQLNISYTIDY